MKKKSKEITILSFAIDTGERLYFSSLGGHKIKNGCITGIKFSDNKTKTIKCK